MPDRADSSQPTVSEVRRYYSGRMSLEERIVFEQRAGASPDFLKRAREIAEVFDALDAVQIRVDKDAIAALFQPAGWPERLKAAILQLRDKGIELSEFAEKGMEAAIELTLDALTGPVQACIRGGTNLNLTFVPSPILTGGKAQRAGKAKEQSRRMAVFATKRIKDARITVDPDARRVMVHFPNPPLPSNVVLIPEDPSESPVIGQIDRKLRSVAFENVPEGRYLLTIPSQN